MSDDIAPIIIAVQDRMAKDDDVMSVFIEVNAAYTPWDKFRYRKLPPGITHVDLWTFIRYNRLMTSNLLRVTDEFGVIFSIPSSLNRSLHEIDMKLVGGLHRLGIPDKEANQYLVRAVMEEAISSSQLEGAATTREVAKNLLRKNIPPRNTDERMIVNNYATINLVRNNTHRDMDLDLMMEIHRSMTRGTLERRRYEGSFRDSDEVFVVDTATGETLHSPPPHEKIPELMDGLLDLINLDEPFIHPIIKASIIHYLIGIIHPFMDGNGRTARALFYWYLIKREYQLVEYLPISRIIKNSPTRYSKAYILSREDGNDCTYFIQFNVNALERALHDLSQYLKRQIRKRKEGLAMLEEGLNERQAMIMHETGSDPYRTFTIREVQKMHSVSYQTARTDLIGLVEAGLFRSVKIGKRYHFSLEQRMK